MLCRLLECWLGMSRSDPIDQIGTSLVLTSEVTTPFSLERKLYLLYSQSQTCSEPSSYQELLGTMLSLWQSMRVTCVCMCVYVRGRQSNCAFDLCRSMLQPASAVSTEIPEPSHLQHQICKFVQRSLHSPWSVTFGAISFSFAIFVQDPVAHPSSSSENSFNLFTWPVYKHLLPCLPQQGVHIPSVPLALQPVVKTSC